MISIITPVRGQSALIPAYERSVQGARVIIVDNSDNAVDSEQWLAMTTRLGGNYLKPPAPLGFAAANNYGLRCAVTDTALFMNNDIDAPAGWLERVERDTLPGHLCGPSRIGFTLRGRNIVYIEGWCMAARRDVWDVLGGWNEDYTGGYWEDNDLCWRARQMGIKLRRCDWPVKHLGNYTSSRTPGAYDHSAVNQARFEQMVNAE